MVSKTDLCREIHNTFLNRWNIENIKEMTLAEYVSVGNKDTFCQWLETRTKDLGSIKGMNSSKFGIYNRINSEKRLNKFVNDNEYSWQRFYSLNSRTEAFNNIKTEIIKLIKYSQNGQFNKIEELHLNPLVRWKIAYLFSNERLIPIFKKDVLVKIANHFGLTANYWHSVSEIQEVMILNKPSHISIYEYAEDLYKRFGGGIQLNSKRVKRKATDSRNTKVHVRHTFERTHIVIQKHNLLQEVLKNNLIKKYGKENVILEENFVDIKVLFKNQILLYEVKSASYASDCVREALGQILSYASREVSEKEVQLIVAGQYKPNEDELKFIEFVKNNLNLSFNYEYVDLY